MKNKKISIFFIRLYAGVLSMLLVITFTGCIFFAGSDTGIAVPNLTVKGAPSDITALSLKVTGPGMAPLESYYSTVPSSIEIEVPAGKDREFELFMYTLSATLRGIATADLKAGATKDITITMGLYETKLVIPDYQNDRIVQIDDISGSLWVELEGSETWGAGWSTNFRPYDIDFDSQGRIYIANYNGIAGYRRVIRVDNMGGSNFFPFPDKGASIAALTIDRENNYLYYAIDIGAAQDQLFRCNLDGTNDIQRNIGAIDDIRGLAVDENGLLYIAYQASIAAYNPISEATLDAVLIDTSSYDIAWDAMVKSSFIYCAVYETMAGSGNLRIIQFTFEAGSLVEQDSYNITLYGPHRFIGTINSRIYFIDENTVPQDRLVSLDAINDNAPEYYGSTGVGIGQFDFYE